MSKIICDVCGTSYPETAAQCPICGCVRSGDPITVAGDTNEAEVQPAASYTYVKGGRFSKANVKKRNAGKPVYSPEPEPKRAEKTPSGKKGEKGLIAAVVVLLLAITAIVIYIACSFFDVKLPFGNPGAEEASSTTGEQTTESTSAEIPCESLKVSDSVLEFDKVGAAVLLNVTALPKGQTDKITFTSENEMVATVDANGKVVSVGAGRTVITVTCGDQTAECSVVCNIAEETTVPEVTYSMDEFKLNREDFTMKTSEPVWVLYKGEIPVDLIEWKSEDESVATFVDGVVTAVGSGATTVSATYQGVTLKCIVRVY